MKNILFICFVFCSIFSFGQMDEEILLIGRNTGQKIVANGDTIRSMGFALSLGENPPIPGPTLEFYEGDSIEIDLWNVSQGAPHTIHLHGLDVNQENDGVPHLSFDVDHMDHGFYRFKAPHAGTYLYHCHVVSSIHVQGGMYGMIIVHPSDESQTTWTGGYEYDVTMSLMMSEIDTIWHNDTIIKHEHDTSLVIHEVELPRYDPQYYLVNGFSDGQIEDEGLALNTAAEAVNYVRLTNIGYKGNRVIFPPSFDAQIIDSDGRPLPDIEISDTVLVYPGERYGILGTMPEQGEDVILVEYFDLNTGEMDDVQEVPIIASGVVGIEDLVINGNTIEVKPNPFDNSVVIDINAVEGGDMVVNLMSLNGEIIDVIAKENVLDQSKNTLVYTNDKLSTGTYIVQVLVNGQLIASQKIIKS